ncbi:MAG: GntR family transcriptional regulator [Maritimibacter sp.]|nr:GntR family transcriptional regulator [Maritimibacter sp.]
MANIQDLKVIEGESTGKTAIETIYSTLRQGILEGTLEPECKLRVEELRLHFGVGSSTVREALSRLLVDKLVVSKEQRGFQVAPVSLEDFREITELRILLETQAVRESVRKGDDEWEDRLVAAAHQLSKIEVRMKEKGDDREFVMAWEERNREFHNALVAACENSWLLRFRATVFAHSFRYRQISLKETSLPRDVRAEHQAIFDAAMARDEDAAARTSEDHIRNSIVSLEAGFSDLRQAI